MAEWQTRCLQAAVSFRREGSTPFFCTISQELLYVKEFFVYRWFNSQKNDILFIERTSNNDVAYSPINGVSEVIAESDQGNRDGKFVSFDGTVKK